ncbi:tetratricopeptide repeat protein [Burkholderia sp. MR1-5-21]
MQKWQPTNPVERRFMDAHTDWISFAKDCDARLMIWQTDETDAQLVRLYFQVQDETSCAVRTMRASFVNESGYAKALTDELIAFYDSRREGSDAQGVHADWQAPYDDGKNHLLYLFTVADSLMQHHPDIFPAMVFVLEPAKVRDEAAWVRWMDGLLLIVAAAPKLGERLRFVVPRTDITPFAALMLRHRAVVRVVQGKYSMASVPRELLAESGERGPSGEFRRQFVMLTETIEGGNPAQLEELRMVALKVAEREQWFDQCVVVHLIAGAAYLKWRDWERAIDAYRSAASNGMRAVEAGHPAGHKLVANGLFGEASVHLTHKNYAHAAYCYERAATSTTAARDGLMTVEAWRMSAVCWERAGEREHALEAGFNALDAGLMIGEPMRVNSSLPLVVEWMVSQLGALDRRRKALSEKVAALRGGR